MFVGVGMGGGEGNFDVGEAHFSGLVRLGCAWKLTCQGISRGGKDDDCTSRTQYM